MRLQKKSDQVIFNLTNESSLLSESNQACDISSSNISSPGFCLQHENSGIRTEKQFFENQLINYKQAAQYLSVSEVYLRKLKAKGKIPFVPIGDRGVRFRVKSLNEWVEKREIR